MHFNVEGKVKNFCFSKRCAKKIWLENAGVNSCTRYSRICEKHFQPSDIKSNLGNYLIKGAVPIPSEKSESGENEKSEVFLFNSPPSKRPEKEKQKTKIIKKIKKSCFSGTPVHLNRVAEHKYSSKIPDY